MSSLPKNRREGVVNSVQGCYPGASFGKCLHGFILSRNKVAQDFPGGPVVKNPLANAGDVGLIPAPRQFYVTQSS